ncbi:hypothetical protein [Morganella psychrotolerans]|uniref:Bacteriocin n=1 Tax=Morganella psychrotolerans TaxID=368603 RepID=A0A1B8GZ25_9GAMM|nr:hypothetical protein [Morganella psychrotolerans]OBU02076.1 hypothetical protein AYY17_13765 [Morganella psychrotolerans]
MRKLSNQEVNAVSGGRFAANAESSPFPGDCTPPSRVSGILGAIKNIIDYIRTIRPRPVN